MPRGLVVVPRLLGLHPLIAKVLAAATGVAAPVLGFLAGANWAQALVVVFGATVALAFWSVHVLGDDVRAFDVAMEEARQPFVFSAMHEVVDRGNGLRQ